MQCPACSTENPAGAMYCQRCGTALGAAPPEPGASQPGASQPGYTPVGGYTQVPQSGPAMPGQAMPAAGPGYAPGAVGGLSDSAAGAIAYLTFIPAIIFLVMEPYSRRPFVRFHAFQCIFLTVASVLLHFAITLSMVALHAFAFILSSLVSLLFFILWLIAIVSAAQGKWFKLPIIGDLAERQARS